MTCSIIGQQAALLSKSVIVPNLQACRCLSCTSFIQDETPLHISCSRKNVLKIYFAESRVNMSSSDMNQCGFWLWGNSKHFECRDNPKIAPDLRDIISQHVLNIFPNTLLSVVIHVILRSKMVADNDSHNT